MARSRSLIAVRKPPTGAVFALHLPQVRGKCRWCGTSVNEVTGFGGKRLFWHEACKSEFDVIIFPDAARRALIDRDRGVCCDCGEDWTDRYLFRAGSTVSFSSLQDRHTKAWLEQYHAERAEGFWVYTELVWVSLWHADHKVPLWKVAHMAPLERIAYFKLANLVTRCCECHARKTAQEAAERAHFDEMAGETAAKPKRSWAKRAMGRPWKPNVRQIDQD